MREKIYTTSQIEKRSKSINGKLWADWQEKEWIMKDSIDTIPEKVQKFIDDLKYELSQPAPESGRYDDVLIDKIVAKHFQEKQAPKTITIGKVQVELKGQAFVICVDTFDYTDWLEGYYDTNEEALEVVRSKGATMLKVHAYDSDGNHIGEAGTF